MSAGQSEKTTYKVSDFLSWQRIGSLLLSPAFQRRPMWPHGAKSLLIDTVVRDIPTPMIFLREVSKLSSLEPQRQVVDGQQRLRTLISYIDPKSLKDFKRDRDEFVVKPVHNEEIANKKFVELPELVQRKILNYQFSVHVLPSQTDDRDVLRIFARMNSTGYQLNDQELRNAEYYGFFKSISYELAYEQLERWRDWKIFDEDDIARMLEVEESSDLMLTIVSGLHARRQKRIWDAYKEYDEKMPRHSEIRRRFREIMDRIEDTVGDSIAMLPFRRRTLFNTLFTFYYDLTYGLETELNRRIPSRLPSRIRRAIKAAGERIAQGDLTEDLAKVLRGATGDLKSRQMRLDFLHKVLRREQK